MPGHTRRLRHHDRTASNRYKRTAKNRLTLCVAADSVAGREIRSRNRRRSGRRKLTRPEALVASPAGRPRLPKGRGIFSFAGWVFRPRSPPGRRSENLNCIMRHTISILVENKFGVLTRIAGLFSGRGFNIDTLNVAPTQDANTSRMTVVTRGDDATLEQIVKQLNKLVDVLKVQDFRDDEYIERELVLIKVAVDSKTRSEVMQITDIFRAKIVDVQPRSLSIEITGGENKIEKFIELVRPFGISELTRTGQIALPRK